MTDVRRVHRALWGQADPGSSPVSAGAADFVRRVDCLRAVFPGPCRLRALYRSDYSRSTVTSVQGGGGSGAGGGVFPAAASYVDVAAVPQLQYVDKVVAVPVVQVVRGLLFLFFDKFVDMPVAAQLQHVDKLVISLLCRSCVLRGARRGEDSPIPQLAIIEKIGEVPEVQFAYDGRCPCLCRSCALLRCRS